MIEPDLLAQMREERRRADELWVRRCLTRAEELQNDPGALAAHYDILKTAWPRICALNVTSPDDLRRFCESLLPLMNLAGDWEWAVDTLEKAIACAGPEKEWPQGKIWLSWFYELTADYRESHAAAREALDSASRLGDPVARCDALSRLAKHHRTLGEYRQAITLYQEAQGLAVAIDDRSQLASVFNSAGLTQWHLGNFEDALASLIPALGFAEAADDLRRQAQVLNNLGLVLMFLGRYEEALDRLQSGLKIAERIGDQREIGVICGNLGEVQLYRKELERALFHQQQAHDRAVQMGSPYRTAKALVRLSRVWREMKTADALPRAAELAQQAAKLGVKNNLHHFEIVGRSYEAVAQAGLQQWETALVLSRQAVEILGQHEFFDGSRPEILFNHFLVAEHDAPAEAANALRAAHEVLMSDAGRIRDLVARERFLTGIELHRTIGDAYRLA